MRGSQALSHLQLLSWLCLLLRDTSPVQGAGPAAQTTGNPSSLTLQDGFNSTENVDCRKVCDLNISERCAFIQTNPDCQSGSGYLNYLKGIFCLFSPDLLPLAVTLYVFWLFYLFLFLAVTAEKFFCPNLSAISTTLKLSHNVAGVTFLAFGNGAPDVFSALVAFSNARTAGLAIGALFGAGVLVTTVVAGSIAIIRPFTAASRPFFRDIIFYMVAIFLTSTVLYTGKVTLAWSLGYLGIYIFYVFTVVLSTWIYQRQSVAVLTPSLPPPPVLESEDGKSSVTSSYDYADEYKPQFFCEESTVRILTRSLSPLDYQKWKRKPWYLKLLKLFKVPAEFLLGLTVPLVDLDKDDRNWKRPLNCLHLFTSPMVCVMTVQSGVYGFYEIQGIFPIWGVTLLVGCFLASVTFFATSNDRPPRFHWIFAFLGFFVSALWINAAATEVVNVLISLGIIFQLSNTILGLTLLAWGNSIGGKVVRCRLRSHSGTAGVPTDGLLSLLWGHHLQYTGGCRSGLCVGNHQKQHRCEVGARWTAGVGLGGSFGAQSAVFLHLSANPVLPAEQTVWVLPALLLRGLPHCGGTHGVWGDSPESGMKNVSRGLAKERFWMETRGESASL